MADNTSSMVAALRGQQPVDDQSAMMPETFVNPFVDKVVRGAIDSGVNMATLPKRLIEASNNDMQHFGDHDYPKETAAPAVEAAMHLVGTGLPMAEAGSAGIFGGRLARTADQRMADLAETMSARGKDPEEIRRATGWFQHPSDNRWRFEIPDNRAGLTYLPTEEGATASGKTGHLFEHPDLYKAYPDLRDLKMSITKDPYASGVFYPPESADAGIHLSIPSYKKGSAIGVHELQHGVQDIEGFSPGTAPNWYAKILEQQLRRNNQPYDFKKLDDAAYQHYMNTSGEVEARNAVNRMYYSPLERLTRNPLQEQFKESPVQNAIDPKTYMIKALKGY
jgi:hypothetical protein